MFIDRASSIARGIGLAGLDIASHEALQGRILLYAVQWHGIPLSQFTYMMRDTWRRVWCYAILADYDVSKALRKNQLCSSTISDIQIRRPGLEMVCSD